MTVEGNRELDMSETTPIPIPETRLSRGQRQKGIKTSISINNIKNQKQKKRNARVRAATTRREVTTGLLRSGWYSEYNTASLLRKYKHPLCEGSEDECCCEFEQLDIDSDRSDDSEVSDDLSFSSCSTQNTSFSSPTTWCSSPSGSSDNIFSIPKKSSSNSKISTFNTPSFFTNNRLKNYQSSESLSKLLNESKVQTTSAFKSNLSNSFKSITNAIKKSAIDLLFYSQNPRSTDDAIPTKAPQSLSWKTKDPAPLQELTTFKDSSTEEVPPLIKPPSYKCFKNREQRINSSFLRLYAYDYNARITGYLPNSCGQEEVKTLIKERPCLKEFDRRYNFHKVSDLSRDKLWNSIILPPRTDPSPGSSIDLSDYIYVGYEDSLSHSIRKHSTIITAYGNYLPWSNNKHSLKPAGILQKSKTHENGVTPSSGITRTQFTSKNWCNPRWMDCSQEESL